MEKEERGREKEKRGKENRGGRGEKRRREKVNDTPCTISPHILVNLCRMTSMKTVKMKEKR